MFLAINDVIITCYAVPNKFCLGGRALKSCNLRCYCLHILMDDDKIWFYFWAWNTWSKSFFWPGHIWLWRFEWSVMLDGPKHNFVFLIQQFSSHNLAWQVSHAYSNWSFRLALLWGKKKSIILCVSAWSGEKELWY